MSILLETTHGNLIIDLHLNQAPTICQNFLQLCHVNYFQYAPFINLRKDFAVELTDPLWPVLKRGCCVWGLVEALAQEHSLKTDNNNTNHENVNEKLEILENSTRYFKAQRNRLKHSKIGTVSLIVESTGPTTTGNSPAQKQQEFLGSSRIQITLNEDLYSLDNIHPSTCTNPPHPSSSIAYIVFGQVVEGFDTLMQINEVVVDDSKQPLIDVRIKRAIVLDDPFANGAGLINQHYHPAGGKLDYSISASDQDPSEKEKNEEYQKELQIVARKLGMVKKEFPEELLEHVRIDPALLDDIKNKDKTKGDIQADSKIPANERYNNKNKGSNDDQDFDNEEIASRTKQSEAKAQALTLEMIGDLPHADIKPAENVLFVCKLNPITQADDLELIFARFGSIVSCEVIKDKLTGKSLCYAFVEFKDNKSCEAAYLKMDGVVVDDRRIRVDFSQSVWKLQRQARSRRR